MRLKTPPTSQHQGAFSGIEDYQLKVSITSEFSGGC